jgi:hypothetical protein
LAGYAGATTGLWLAVANPLVSSCCWWWCWSSSVVIRLCWRFLRLLFSRERASSAANPTLARHPRFIWSIQLMTMFKKKS